MQNHSNKIEILCLSVITRLNLGFHTREPITLDLCLQVR